MEFFVLTVRCHITLQGFQILLKARSSVRLPQDNLNFLRGQLLSERHCLLRKPEGMPISKPAAGGGLGYAFKRGFSAFCLG